MPISRWVWILVACWLSASGVLADVGIELETRGGFQPGSEVSFSARLTNLSRDARTAEMEISALGAGLRLMGPEGTLECSAALPFAEALKTCRMSVAMEANGETGIPLRLAVPEEFVQREIRISASVSSLRDSDSSNNLSVVRLRRSVASGSDVRLTLVDEGAGVLRIELRNGGATPSERGRLKVFLKGAGLRAEAIEPLPGVECGAGFGSESFCRSTPDFPPIRADERVEVRIQAQAEGMVHARAEYLAHNEIRPDDNVGAVELPAASSGQAARAAGGAVPVLMWLAVAAVAALLAGVGYRRAAQRWPA